MGGQVGETANRDSGLQSYNMQLDCIAEDITVASFVEGEGEREIWFQASLELKSQKGATLRVSHCSTIGVYCSCFKMKCVGVCDILAKLEMTACGTPATRNLNPLPKSLISCLVEASLDLLSTFYYPKCLLIIALENPSLEVVSKDKSA